MVVHDVERRSLGYGGSEAPRARAAGSWRLRHQRRDLETRVTNRKLELISEIIEHKKNCSRFGAAEEIDRIKAKLSELAVIVQEGVADWANLDPRARARLDEWLAR